MAITCHECFFVFLLLVNGASLTVGELLCHHFLTVVARGTESRGVLTTNEFVFTKGYYESFNSTHYRVCICTKIPCLRKCCPLGQVFLNKTCNSTFDLDINPNVYTPELKLIPDYGVWNFHRVYGDTCKHKSFQLEPESFKSDEHFLLSNGTLILPFDNTTYDTSQFCFENMFENLNDAFLGKKNLRTFVCFPEDISPDDNYIVYPIAMIISMPFLLATFIVYSLPELRNLHGKNLMSHVASLLTAYIALVITQLGANNMSDIACVVCGFLTPYAFLATFFWLNVMCFDIWSTFSGFGKFSGHAKEKENKKFMLYSLYAWGCPTIILIVTVAIDYAPNVPDFIVKPNIGTSRCYFETKLATLCYFYAPMAVIVICDITLFALTAIKICKVRKETKVLTGNESRRNDDASKQRYNLYLKLFMVMGINWVMELISWVLEGPKEFWYVTDVMNSLQGVLIFVICVLTQGTKKRISKRFSRSSSKSSSKTEKTNTGLFIFWIFVCSRKVKKVLVSRFCPKYASREMETNTSSLKMSANSSVPTTEFVMNNIGPKKGPRVM